MSHVLISGGSRGIGAGIVKRFEDEGWNVTYLYLNAPGHTSDKVRAVKCDVRDPEAVKTAVNEAVKAFGDIDTLVSNSGISLSGLSTDMTFDDYRSVTDTNFGGLYNLAGCIIPSMVHRKSGNIIAISSMWGQTGASCEALYSASKGAVDSYVRSLAKELGPSGIRVNAVSPGVIKTDMLGSYSEEDLAFLAEETPLQRLGAPEDIASAVYFLASNEASFITGQILGVNGGFLI